MFSSSSFIEKHEEVRAEREQLRVTREQYATKLAQGRAVAKAASHETAKRRRAQEQRRKQKEQAEEERRRSILAQRKTQHQQQVSQYRRRSDADARDTSSRTAATTTTTGLKPKAVALKTSSSFKQGRNNGPTRGLGQRAQTTQPPQESSASEWPFRVRPVPEFARPGNWYAESSAATPTQSPQPVDIEAALRAIGATVGNESCAATQMTHSGEAESSDGPRLTRVPARPASVQDMSVSDSDQHNAYAERRLEQQTSIESTQSVTHDEAASEEHESLDGEESQETAEESCSELEVESSSTPSSYQPVSPKKHPDTQHLFEHPATISLETSEAARRKERFSQRPGSSSAWESNDSQAQRHGSFSTNAPILPEIIQPSATPDLGQFSDSLEMISVSTDVSDDEQAKASSGVQKTLAQDGGIGKPSQSTSKTHSPAEDPRLSKELPGELPKELPRDASSGASNDNLKGARTAMNSTLTRPGAGRPLPPQYLKAAGRSSSLSSIQKPPPPALERRLSCQNMLAKSEVADDPVPRGILKRTEHNTMQRMVAAMETELKMSRPQSAECEHAAPSRRISFLEHDIILNEGERHAPPPVHCVEPPSQRHQQQAPRVQPPPFSPSNAFFLAAQRQKAQRQQRTRALDLAPMPPSSEPDHSQQRVPRAGLQSTANPTGRPRHISPAAPKRVSVSEQQLSHAADTNDMVWNQVRRCLSTARHDRQAVPSDTTRTAMTGTSQAAAAAAAPGNVRLRRQSHPSTASGSNGRSADPFQRGVVGRTFYHSTDSGSVAGSDADSVFQRATRDGRPQPTAALAATSASSTASRKSGGGYRSRGMPATTNGASYSRMLEHYTTGDVSANNSRVGGNQRDPDNVPSDSGTSIASSTAYQGTGQKKSSKAVSVNTELIRREQDMIQSLERVEALLQGKVSVATTNEVQSYLASQARRPLRSGTRVFLKPPPPLEPAAEPPEESSAVQSAAINAYVQQQHQDMARKRSKGRTASFGHASHGNGRAAGAHRRGSTGGSASSFHGTHT